MKLKKKMKISHQTKYVSLEKENDSVQKENRKEKEGKSQLIWQSCIITIVIEALRSGKQQEKYWRFDAL